MTGGPAHEAARPVHVVVFVSGHGFGHATRTSAVLRALASRIPLRMTVVTAAPRALWPAELATMTDRWLAIECDAGVVQSDDLHVDADATRDVVRAWRDRAAATRGAILRELAKGDDVACVIGDVPPLAFEIADHLRRPSVAIANFSWDWIYESLGLDAAARESRAAYERATLLLELTPETPMPAFARRSAIGVIGRRAGCDVAETRRALGLAPGDRCVLLSLRSPALERVRLPPARAGLRFLCPRPLETDRSDVVVLPQSVPYLDALATADLVLSKTGYSIIGDCAANGGRFLWVRRKGFPEDAHLARWLEAQDWAVEMSAESLAGGAWGEALESVLDRPRASFDVDRTLATAAGEIAALLSQ